MTLKFSLLKTNITENLLLWRRFSPLDQTELVAFFSDTSIRISFYKKLRLLNDQKFNKHIAVLPCKSRFNDDF